MKTFLFALLTLTSSFAQAGVIYLKPGPAPAGYFADPDFPYTFASGLSDDGQTVLGVCGYGGYYSRHTAYACTWDLTGKVTMGAPLTSGAAAPTHGVFYWYEGRAYFVIATSPQGYELGFTDSTPRQAVLITP